MLSSGWQSTDDVMPSSPFTMHCVLRSRGYDRADLAERAKEGRSINSCVDLGFFFWKEFIILRNRVNLRLLHCFTVLRRAPI
jgi:hypothetical protein